MKSWEAAALTYQRANRPHDVFTVIEQLQAFRARDRRLLLWRSEALNRIGGRHAAATIAIKWL
ncbi:MAG: hypothetical protein AAFP90_02060 [Planctomycetota bacterium]